MYMNILLVKMNSMLKWFQPSLILTFGRLQTPKKNKKNQWKQSFCSETLENDIKVFCLSHDAVTWCELWCSDCILPVFFRRQGQLVTRHLINHDALLWLSVVQIKMKNAVIYSDHCLSYCILACKTVVVRVVNTVQLLV